MLVAGIESAFTFGTIGSWQRAGCGTINDPQAKIAVSNGVRLLFVTARIGAIPAIEFSYRAPGNTL